LFDTEFPETRWTVHGLLPVGLNILAGRPKTGKSWLALQIAHAVATGGQVFNRQAQRGSVLFIALEDSPKRLRDRCKQQHVPRDAQIIFFTEWSPLDDNGIVELQEEIEREGYTLVVIDTFSRAIRHADQRDLTQMTGLGGALQNLAGLYGVTILMVDHHRKGNAGLGPDPIDDIMESTGKTAVADCILGLYREPGRRGATLRGRGRDIDEIDLSLQFDPITCTWVESQSSSEKAILDALNALIARGELATNTSIAEYTGKDKAQVNRILADLLQAGQVVRLPRVGKLQPYGRGNEN